MKRVVVCAAAALLGAGAADANEKMVGDWQCQMANFMRLGKITENYFYNATLTLAGDGALEVNGYYVSWFKGFNEPISGKGTWQVDAEGNFTANTTLRYAVRGEDLPWGWSAKLTSDTSMEYRSEDTIYLHGVSCLKAK